MKNFFLIGYLSFSLFSCVTHKKPLMQFKAQEVPPAPNYADMNHWAASPFKWDYADKVPDTLLLKDVQATAEVDVFFLHPTSYTYKKGFTHWNADVRDAALNLKTDKGSILNQASIFNGVGRVFAPRYRQAHLEAFFTQDSVSALSAFEVAYSDIKAAFEYYLQHHHGGRPIIIAAHSQGTRHAARLLAEFFDGKPLQTQLIVAYVVGLPVPKNLYMNIPNCVTPEQTGCYCSWRTYERGFYPSYHRRAANILVTNPLTWTTDTAYAPTRLNQGAVFWQFSTPRPNLVDAQVHDGLLWVHKPKFRGSWLIRTHNFHPGDYNMFYMNIRENVQYRTRLFLSNRKS